MLTALKFRKIMQQVINWEEAKKISDQVLKEIREEKKQYEENLSRANEMAWDALGSDNFRSSDISDIALNSGVDEEDLIWSLI
jgi:polyhydroxyalkanoate synthesis regulator phasin